MKTSIGLRATTPSIVGYQGSTPGSSMLFHGICYLSLSLLEMDKNQIHLDRNHIPVHLDHSQDHQIARIMLNQFLQYSIHDLCAAQKMRLRIIPF